MHHEYVLNLPIYIWHIIHCAHHYLPGLRNMAGGPELVGGMCRR